MSKTRGQGITDEGKACVVALRGHGGHGHRGARAEAWCCGMSLRQNGHERCTHPFKLPACCGSLHLWLKVKHDMAELLVDVVHDLTLGPQLRSQVAVFQSGQSNDGLWNTPQMH